MKETDLMSNLKGHVGFLTLTTILYFRSSINSICKPVSAPPPPPPSLSRPSAPPPPPPSAKTCAGPPPPPPQRSPATRISSQKTDNSEVEGETKKEEEKEEKKEKEEKEEVDKMLSLTQFVLFLFLQISPIRKTGFDFLDNWRNFPTRKRRIPLAGNTAFSIST